MKNRVFPSAGQLWRELEGELLKSKDDDFDWRHSLFSIGWPTLPEKIELVAEKAASMFFNYDVSEGYAQPSVRRIESEVMQMTLEILNAPDGSACTVTSGGTESNFLAVKTARDWARTNRPEAEAPQILVPATAHPSFNKGRIVSRSKRGASASGWRLSCRRSRDGRRYHRQHHHDCRLLPRPGHTERSIRFLRWRASPETTASGVMSMRAWAAS